MSTTPINIEGYLFNPPDIPSTVSTPSFDATLANLHPMQPNYSDPATAQAAMSGGNPLNALGEPALPNVTQASSTTASTPDDTAGTWQNKVSNFVNGLVGYDPNSTGILKTFANINLEDVTILIVGLLLLAAGIFSFKQTQSVINVASRAASKTAEIAAT